MSELGDTLKALRARLDEFAANVDVETKRATVTQLEGRMSDPGFWDNQERARGVIEELKESKGIVDTYTEVEEGLEACRELLDLVEVDDDQAAGAEIAEELSRLDAALSGLEIRLALGGPYDRNNVFMSIIPGAGGTDACDWAEMMVRMYANYCEKAGYQCSIIEMQAAAEAGIKSAILHIRGNYAYGHLKSEMGTHRLVRMSPFNASGTRETSFAAVEVTPELEETGEVTLDDLDEKEFRIDTYRASGAGGQHVNKTDSAVRITHIPTGIVTACQSERSQQQNKHQAWTMMVAKLQQVQDAERLEELRDLGCERGTIGWGHQIRSYVLQPTQLITDLRTRHKEGNAQKVLNGDIQEFIDAYLNRRLKEGRT